MIFCKTTSFLSYTSSNGRVYSIISINFRPNFFIKYLASLISLSAKRDLYATK